MSQRPRILAVDDNALNLLIIQESLVDEDCELMTVTSGEEALEVVHEFRPDVVLLDIMMPGIDGYEVCRRMRADPRLEGLVIVFVSAKAMDSERSLGLATGADDYVTKPFAERDLRERIRVQLEARRA